MHDHESSLAKLTYDHATRSVLNITYVIHRSDLVEILGDHLRVCFILCAVRCCLDQCHRPSHFCLNTRLMHTVSIIVFVFDFPLQNQKSKGQMLTHAQYIRYCGARACSCARSDREKEVVCFLCFLRWS